MAAAFAQEVQDAIEGNTKIEAPAASDMPSFRVIKSRPITSSGPYHSSQQK